MQRRDWRLSVGTVLLAFLATQHHNLMMLLVVIGIGDAGMSLMTFPPLVRDAMLLMSLLMAAVIAYQISTPGRSTATRVTGALSVALTVGLAGWSLITLGL